MILTVCFLWLWSVALIYWYVVNREKDDIRDGVPLLLWWTNDVTWPYNELRRCGARTCHVTNNHKKLQEARVRKKSIGKEGERETEATSLHPAFS